MIAANRRRIVLAAYLDYLVLGALASLLVWALESSIPALRAVSLPARLAVFLVVEILLLRQARWSPGSWLLALKVHRPSDLEGASQPTLGGRVFLVDRAIAEGERWWTFLLGVLSILSGAKSLARWTQFVAPAAVFGIPVDDGSAVAFHLVTGAATLLFAVGVFRLVPSLLAGGVVFHAIAAVS